LQNYRFLVTGGAGFIGSELVRQLAARGPSVRVVDNLVNGRRENLEGVLNSNVELIVGDIRDRALMSSLLREVVRFPSCLPRCAAFDSFTDRKRRSKCHGNLGPVRHCSAHECETLRVHLNIRSLRNGNDGSRFRRASYMAHDGLRRLETRWRSSHSRFLA
jgi:NAD(P)-dependent dehydrogenase (short-subunit alcohol dehydrogenase family)